MKYLLDTHVLLWIAYEEHKISSKIKKILLSESSTFYLSAVSFWEISIKSSMGKLDLKSHSPETLYKGFEANFPCDFLPLSIEEAVTFFKLDKVHHKDPFDRMLVWQAIKNELIIISEDNSIKLYEDTGVKVLW